MSENLGEWILYVWKQPFCGELIQYFSSFLILTILNMQTNKCKLHDILDVFCVAVIYKTLTLVDRSNHANYCLSQSLSRLILIYHNLLIVCWIRLLRKRHGLGFVVNPSTIIQILYQWSERRDETIWEDALFNCLSWRVKALVCYGSLVISFSNILAPNSSVCSWGRLQ